MAGKKHTAAKPAKKRSSKGKKPALGRTKIYIALVLFTLLFAGLFYLALNNKPTGQVAQKTEQKTEQIQAVNVAQKIKKEQKNVRESVKFDKDENLSRIFLDPNSTDETSALSYKEHKKQPLPEPPAKPKEPQQIIIPKIQPKEQQNSQDDKIRKPNELDVVFNDSAQVIKEQNLTSQTPSKIEPKIKTEDKPQPTKTSDNKTEPTNPKLEPKLEPPTELKQKDNNKQAKTQTDKKNLNEEPSKSQKQPDEPQNLPASQTKQKQPSKNGKARLVIIIDDVATHAHAHMIRSTGLRLTPSIFPANKAHPDTPSIARSFEFFMIHLPMQANGGGREEIDTLHVGESYQSILKKVKKIRADFPTAKFINNHTGSRFTSDFESMNRAFGALISEGFVFVDSRTTPASKASAIAKKYSQPYIVRDVFLDDLNSQQAIRKELEKAVSIAQRRGIAIAIGHPRPNTIAVLKSSKKLLENVEIIYLKDAHELLKR